MEEKYIMLHKKGHGARLIFEYSPLNYYKLQNNIIKALSFEKKPKRLRPTII